MTLVMSHCIHSEICSIQRAEISYGRLKTWLLCLWVSSGVPWHFSPMYTKRSVGQKIAPDVIKVLLISDHDFLFIFFTGQAKRHARANSHSAAIEPGLVWCYGNICDGGFKGCTLKIICWGNAYLEFKGTGFDASASYVFYRFCIGFVYYIYLFIYYIVLFFFHLCAATNFA